MQSLSKYRVWNRTQKSFVNPDNYFIDLCGNLYEDIHFESPLKLEQKDFILQQFTGLLDKNGKEIYEGDIVKSWRRLGEKWGWYIGRVNYCNVDACFQVLTADRKDEEIGSYLICDGEEVIGNIFENPSLLNP